MVDNMGYPNISCWLYLHWAIPVLAVDYIYSTLSFKK